MSGVQYTPEEIAEIRKAIRDLYEKNKFGGGTPGLEMADYGYLRAINDVSALWLDLDLKKLAQVTKEITADIAVITAALAPRVV